MKLHYPDPGMTLHGVNACENHAFEKYDPDKDKNKPAMFWLYYEDDYKLLARHTGKRYICWHGSDVLWFKDKFTKYLTLIRNPEITHIFLNNITQSEMFEYGIYGIQRFIFWGDSSKYQPESNLTKDCYMCCNKDRGIVYGEFIFNSLAWRYPDWTFHIFGIEPTVPVYCDNVKYYGWIPENEMDDITRSFGLCLRYNGHDGFPQIICKALIRNHFVITRLEYDGLTTVVNNTSSLFYQIDRIGGCIDQGQTYKNEVMRMINNFDFI